MALLMAPRWHSSQAHRSARSPVTARHAARSEGIARYAVTAHRLAQHVCSWQAHRSALRRAQHARRRPWRARLTAHRLAQHVCNWQAHRSALTRARHAVLAMHRSPVGRAVKLSQAESSRSVGLSPVGRAVGMARRPHQTCLISHLARQRDQEGAVHCDGRQPRLPSIGGRHPSRELYRLQMTGFERRTDLPSN